MEQIVVERVFDEPLDLDDLVAIQEKGRPVATNTCGSSSSFLRTGCSVRAQ